MRCRSAQTGNAVQHGQPATHEPANSPCGNLFGLPLPMRPDGHNASTSVQHTCACGAHRTRKNQKGGGRDYRYPPVSRSPHPPGTFSNKKIASFVQRALRSTDRHVPLAATLTRPCSSMKLALACHKTTTRLSEAPWAASGSSSWRVRIRKGQCDARSKRRR